MPDVNIIVAYDDRRVIGNKGDIPWKIPADMKRFKELTNGGVVIMGRKTWDSLPPKFRPLPNRINIMLTRQKNEPYTTEPHICHALDEALWLAKKLCPEGKDIWIIGGSEIYKKALDEGWVDNIYATEVEGEHEGDAFFPEIRREEWNVGPLHIEDGHTFVTYQNKKEIVFIED